MDGTPLKMWALAPNFTLPSTDGTVVTRGQFRNKSGLALIFVPSVTDPTVVDLLNAVAKDTEAYRELRAKVFVISRMPGDAPLPVLVDADGTAWKAYTELIEPGYGVFVLDRYGGVDSQVASTDASRLPDAATIREWMQSAMYKCNI